ncbi:MAG: hypothetical protein WA687_07580 [Solirubrobacterales bacterium]
MLSIALWFFATSIIPRVENPWPESIGLEFPFTLAGAGTIFVGFIYAEASQARRDRASRQGGFYGFVVGSLIYAFSLVNQIAFGL